MPSKLMEQPPAGRQLVRAGKVQSAGDSGSGTGQDCYTPRWLPGDRVAWVACGNAFQHCTLGF